MTNRHGFSRRGLLKFGLLGGTTLGIVSAFYRPNWLDEASPDVSFAVLSESDRHFLQIVSELLIGIPRGRLSEEQLYQLMLAVDRTIRVLNPDIRKEIGNIFHLVQIPMFRWYVGLFNVDWVDAEESELLKALDRFRDAKIDLVRVAYLNLQSIVVSSYYSQSFSWDQIGFPGFIEFGN
ncbi:MAG: hypothetical protein HRU19_25515 [Pseudobacteriovorax sp.]|nr:hypothetical protein [Pseudobacteriovorax sp.]